MPSMRRTLPERQISDQWHPVPLWVLKTGRSNLHAFNAQNVAGAADIRPMAWHPVPLWVLKTGTSNLHAFNAQNVAGAADIRPMAWHCVPLWVLKTDTSNLHAFNAQNVAGAADIRPMALCTIVGAESKPPSHPVCVWTGIHNCLTIGAAAALGSAAAPAADIRLFASLQSRGGGVVFLCAYLSIS